MQSQKIKSNAEPTNLLSSPFSSSNKFYSREEIVFDVKDEFRVSIFYLNRSLNHGVDKLRPVDNIKKIYLLNSLQFCFEEVIF